MDDWRPFVGDDLCGRFSHVAYSDGVLATLRGTHGKLASLSRVHLLGVTNSVRGCAGRNTWRIDKDQIGTGEAAAWPLARRPVRPCYGVSWIGLAGVMRAPRIWIGCEPPEYLWYDRGSQAC